MNRADRADTLADLAVHVGELVRPIYHAAEYESRGVRSHRLERHVHITRQPSLLDQLRRGMVVSPSPADDCMLRRAHGSRPPLRTDALDALMRIEAFSARLVTERFGLRLRSTVEANLSALVGVASGLDDAGLRVLASEVRSWWTWARTVTDWEAPPWRPNVPCPACEAKGLRIRLDTQSAVCVSCGEVWPRESIGILADYVRMVTGTPVVEVAG